MFCLLYHCAHLESACLLWFVRSGVFMVFLAGVDLLADYEKAGYGLTWANIGDDGFSMARVLILLIADSVLYIILAW